MQLGVAQGLNKKRGYFDNTDENIFELLCKMISFQLKNATTHSDYMIHEFKLKKLLNVGMRF